MISTAKFQALHPELARMSDTPRAQLREAYLLEVGAAMRSRQARLEAKKRLEAAIFRQQAPRRKRTSNRRPARALRP